MKFTKSKIKILRTLTEHTDRYMNDFILKEKKLNNDHREQQLKHMLIVDLIKFYMILLNRSL